MSKWRWVPVEPEQEMLDAAYDAQGYQARQGMRAAWAAMLAAAPTPQPEAVAWPKVNGTARMFDNARALMVIMEREPTDDEMRAFDDAIKGWGTSPPAAPQPEAQPVIPPGFRIMPDWKGYALLGTGRYAINHSAPPADPELGAELFITFATEAEKSGGRQIGERRDNPPDAPPTQPDDMVIRIGFLSERAVFALEDQLQALREAHGWAAPPPAAPCPHIRSSGVGAHATHWCALAEQPQPEAQPSMVPAPDGSRVLVVDAAPPPAAPEPSRTLTQNERDVFDAALRRSTKVVAPEPSEAARLYIDGEWNSYRGELLSLALVGEDDSEWYEVIDFDGTPEPWVAANVMPKLRKAPVSLEWMQGSLQRFLDRYPAGVHIVADWPEDIERFCRVLVTGPGQRLDTPPLTMEVVRIDPVSADPHNALADARALRDALRAAAAARGR